MITVVDYDMGNVGSILNMLKRAGHAVRLSFKKEDLLSATALILPGVGSFDQGVKNLQARGLTELLHECVIIRKIPILGICLGMQLMTRASEEGILPGLSWLEAETYRFKLESKSIDLRIPHMGWNYVQAVSDSTNLTGLAKHLFSGSDPRQQYYFVHSYYVRCDRSATVLATTKHGDPFASAIGRAHIVGTQFHPEKSHRFGLHLLRNFADFASKQRLVTG